MQYKETRGKQDLSYLAGIIDADGYIGVRKTKPSTSKGTINPSYELCLNVTNTSKTLMEWLTSRFGGKVYKRNHKGENWKPIFDWRIMNKSAAKLLQELNQFLVVKKAQAMLGIELEINRVVNNHGTSEEELIRRERIYQIVRELNQTGLCSLND